MNARQTPRRDVDVRLAAARREVDALAERGRWPARARAEAHVMLALAAANATGPREIADRYCAVVHGLGRGDRARTWQIVRRVAQRDTRDVLDRLYRNVL